MSRQRPYQEPHSHSYPPMSVVTGYWLLGILKCSRTRRKVPVAINTHTHIEDCCTAMAITDTIFHSPEKAVRSKHPQQQFNTKEPKNKIAVLELVIPPTTGWVAQWQSVLRVMG